MLRYILESIENGLLTYRYYPEGNLAAGKVVFAINGERVSYEDSPDDVKGWYRGHAFSGIDLTQKQGMVAWY